MGNSSYSRGDRMKSASELVAKARIKIENLSPEQVAAEQADGALVVDIREQNEREANGVIPDSHFAPRGMLEWYADPSSAYHRPEFDPNRRIILHCAAGGRSALSAATLKEMGYQNVAHLDGGITAWKEKGFSIESA